MVNVPEVMTWGRNRNIVRHSRKNLGPFSSIITVGLLVLVVGLIYVTQGTKTSNYDYELSGLDREIAELKVRKDELMVEQARLTSVANSAKSEVASTMKDGKISGYVGE